MAGKEQRKHAVRRWKLEKPHEGQFQSPGRGRFLLGGKGLKMSAARSSTRLEEGETSMAFSLRARPFMHKLSAAYGKLAACNGVLATFAYLFVGRKNGETRASGLVLIGRTQRPEGNRATAELGEPALEFRLCSVMGKTAHVQNLTPLREESANVGAGIHWFCEHVGVVLRRLGFADESSEHACKCDCLFHSPPWRGRSEGLQVERQVVLNRRRRLHRLNLKGSADIGQGTGAERQALGMVRLPALILGAQIKSTRMLQVGGQYNGLVTGLTGQLHSKIPAIKGDESKLKVLGQEVILGKGVEAIDGVAEGACITHLIPCQSSQTRWCVGQPMFGAVCRQMPGRWRRLTAQGRDGGVDGLYQDALAVQLGGSSAAVDTVGGSRRTSSQLFASSSIQPNSITSALSLVT